MLRVAVDQINRWWMASGRGSLLRQVPNLSQLLHRFSMEEAGMTMYRFRQTHSNSFEV